jgi:hypothetical protein
VAAASGCRVTCTPVLTAAVVAAKLSAWVNWADGQAGRARRRSSEPRLAVGWLALVRPSTKTGCRRDLERDNNNLNNWPTQRTHWQLGCPGRRRLAPAKRCSAASSAVFSQKTTITCKQPSTTPTTPRYYLVRLMLRAIKARRPPCIRCK